MPQASGELEMALVPSVQGYTGKLPQELRLHVCELVNNQQDQILL